MERKADHSRGFTITELVVVISSVALLLALVLPGVGGVRSFSGTDASLNNLVTLSIAHVLYAGDWDGRQFSSSRDDFGAEANSFEDYMDFFPNRYNIPIGWAEGTAWIVSRFSCASCYEPIVFTGGGAGAGAFRFYNHYATFHAYVGGRVYDPVFFSPTDTAVYEFAEPAFDDPWELVLVEGPIIKPPSYCLSPVALFTPEVMRAPSAGGWQNPWFLFDGFVPPPLAGAAYPDLKTHMIEHNWTQNPPLDCNPAFPGGTYDGCEPFYFNHGIDSSPAALFYDGHTRLLPNSEVLAADQQILDQTGGIDGLWSRDTPFGESGYFIDFGYDGTPLSHHVLTTDGILGRDTLGPGPPLAPLTPKSAREDRQLLVAPRLPVVFMERVKP